MMTEPERYMYFPTFEEKEYFWEVVLLIDLKKFSISKHKKITGGFIKHYFNSVNVAIDNDHLVWDDNSHLLSNSVKEYIEECFRIFKLKAFL